MFFYVKKGSKQKATDKASEAVFVVSDGAIVINIGSCSKSEIFETETGSGNCKTSGVGPFHRVMCVESLQSGIKPPSFIDSGFVFHQYNTINISVFR